jgi:hypothetical protein
VDLSDAVDFARAHRRSIRGNGLPRLSNAGHYVSDDDRAYGMPGLPGRGEAGEEKP